jgi:hypothetical protein
MDLENFHSSRVMNHAASHHHPACGCGHDAAPAPRGGSVLACLILALWGAVMLYFYGSGRIEHYLSAEGPFRVQCLLAGIGLLLLAGANLWFTLRGKAVHGHDGPPTTAAALGMVAVLGIPLTLAALRSPDRYSDAFFLMKVHAAPVAVAGAAGAFTIGELERLCGGRTAAGDIPLGLEQVFQLASQPDDVRKVIESVRIETVGQIVRDPADPTCWRLSRLIITCCAADARAVSVSVAFDGDPSQWQQLGWYRAVGQVAVDRSGLPVLKVESMSPAEPPRNLMVY